MLQFFYVWFEYLLQSKQKLRKSYWPRENCWKPNIKVHNRGPIYIVYSLVLLQKKQSELVFYETLPMLCKVVCLHAVRSHVQWRDEVTRQFFVNCSFIKVYLTFEDATITITHIMDNAVCSKISFFFVHILRSKLTANTVNHFKIKPSRTKIFSLILDMQE